MNKYRIILLKAENENNEDEYLKLFKNYFEHIYCLSPIKFEFINLVQLNEKLKTKFLDNYSSLVITSPRAIQIIKKLINDKQFTLDELQNLPSITVGPQTYKKFMNEFNFNPIIDNINLNINNGKELANYINDNCDKLSEKIDLNKPFLYLTSNLSKEELKLNLNNKFKVEKLICYQTLPNNDLDIELNELLNNNLDTELINRQEVIENQFLFIFFSPSGVINFKETINCIKLDKLKLIAIGQTTKKSIEDNNLNLISTSSKPTPESLLECILDLIKKL